jgi:ribosomal protein L7/L12
MNYLSKVKKHSEKALENLKKIEEKEKFSLFARSVFNEIGHKGNVTKAEDMLNQIYQIAMSSEKDEDKIKAIKVFAEMVGGGLNEKQTNIQNNNYGTTFLEMLSDDK